MDSHSEQLKTYGFVAVVLGFFLFVLADSGVISWRKWTTSSKSEPDARNEEISQLKAQLEELKGNTKVRRERLHSLINQLHEIDNSLDSEAKELKKLAQANQAITTLAEKAKTKRRAPSDYKASFENRATKWKFESWNEVVTKVQEITNQAATVETHEQTLSFIQPNLFADETPYLRPEGLRVAQAVAVGAQRLGADSISVTYSDDSKTSEERARVASRYFKKLLGEQVPVNTMKVAENLLKAPEKVEFWVNLKTEGSP